MTNNTWYTHWGKRSFDTLLASVAGAVTWPIVVLAAALVKLTSAGPAFFVQERYGRHGKLFWLFKLRTMVHCLGEEQRERAVNGGRVTRLGGILRRFKVDELPQLLNVIRGEMSFVGPRPALPSQLNELDEYGRRRLEVRPGLTGLSQVSGNIGLPWKERWKRDAEYVDRMSLALDLGILLKTFGVVVLGERRFLK